MSEQFNIEGETKQEKYESFYLQLKALTKDENDLIANLSNCTSAIKSVFGFYWIGFYIVKNDELVLGPFQGTIACTRIKKGKGVCGNSWLKKETIIVDDVDQFPGHIACSSESKSEIVVPIIKNNEVIAVLDIDDNKYSTFDRIDKAGLEKLADLAVTWFS
jgi:L-methionine (R)-S-oxide reductase